METITHGMTYKATPFDLSKIRVGCHPIHLIEFCEQKYDLTYKAVPFGLTKIVSGLFLELTD